MSICPTSNNTKYKTNYPYTPNDASKKPKDEPRQQLSKRNPKRAPLDGKRGSLDAQKGSLVERRNYGRQANQNGQRFDGRSSLQNPNDRKTDPCLRSYSKKASLNHLLNFKFEPRSKSENFHRQTPRAKSRATQDFETFSREKFLQANCQFYVSQNGNYDVHLADPDVPVPWDQVECVWVWNEVPSQCPICLFPPSVPKITQCGHIYCWPCMLHYLALGDKGSQKCPICHEMVHGRDLRSVEEYHDDTVVVGSEITMRLMCCSKSNAVPRPALDSDVDSSKSESGRDVKIVKISPLDVLNRIVEKEMRQLKEKKAAGDLDPVEMMFVDSAIKECEIREAKVIAVISENCCGEALESLGMGLGNNMETLDKDSAAGMKDEADDFTVDEKPVDSHMNGNHKTKNEDLYYFYQCEEGRHIYVHGLNVKCLLREYQNFARCPKVIQGRILEIEGHTMTQNLRKRHRFLSHLPLMCEFKVVELDLETPVLSEETLEEFREQIERRASNRRKKERSETKMSQRLEMYEKRKQESYYSGRGFGMDTRTGGGGSVSVLVHGQQAFTTAVGQTVGKQECNKVNTMNDENTASGSTVSFAQMLKSTSPTLPEVMHKPRVNHVTSNMQIETTNTENGADSDDPDYVPPPTYQYSFGNAISEAISRVSVSDHSGTGKTAQGKKGKRKKKQTLLFSTSQMHHA